MGVQSLQSLFYRLYLSGQYTFHHLPHPLALMQPRMPRLAALTFLVLLNFVLAKISVPDCNPEHGQSWTWVGPSLFPYLSVYAGFLTDS